MILETVGLIAIGKWIGSKILDKGFDSIYKKVTEKNFDQKFYDVVDIAAQKIEKKYPKTLGGNISYLFKHDSILNQLFRLLFINSEVNIKVIEDRFDVETLPKNFIFDFIVILKAELSKDNYFREILLDKELFVLTVGINNSVDDIAEYTKISTTEISEIKELLEKKFKSNFNQVGFLKSYRKSLNNNYSQLNFIGLGIDSTIKKGKRKKLEDLFVKPNFQSTKKSFDLFNLSSLNYHHDEILSLEDIFKFNCNLIILGNPGSGKSVLSKFLTLKVIQKDKTTFDCDNILDFIPFRIELRKYHAFKKEKEKGIISYISSLLETDFGFSNIAISEIINIINERKTLLIFDGLDEIFDINDKIGVKNDIENFKLNYSKVKIIVTSRIVGYEETAFDEEMGLKLFINDFNENQITEYVNNWYSIEEDDKEIRNNEINDFLKKKQLIDNELISNPLLLSLIVILYRNNLKVPESKLEIYQSCTKTLVDKWDKSKGIEIDLQENIYIRKNTIFADLAYWQYKELSNQDGKITYQRAKNTIVKTLRDKLKVTDEFTSDDDAENFLKYARKRSLYFDDNFTHKTFLEYYTAFWIFSNIENKHKKEERDSLIKEYVINPYWHIVLELLINMIDKNQADNEIIDDLINNQLTQNRNSCKFFLQIYPTIQNVSSTVYDRIIDLSIEELLFWSKDKKQTDHIGFNSLFSNLLSQFNSSFKILIENKLVEKAIEKPEQEIEILSLYLELFENSTLENVFENKAVIFKDKLNELKKSDELLYVFASYDLSEKEFENNPIIFLEEFVNNFSVNSLLSSVKSRYSGFSFVPYLYIGIKNLIKHPEEKKFYDFIELMNNLKIENLEYLKLINQYRIGEKDFPEIKKCLLLLDKLNETAFTDIAIILLYKIVFSMISFRREKEMIFLDSFSDLLTNKKLKDFIYLLKLNNPSRINVQKILIKEYNFTFLSNK